ncbi:hypothetical protein EV1_039764 [Malus domestica]
MNKQHGMIVLELQNKDAEKEALTEKLRQKEAGKAKLNKSLERFWDETARADLMKELEQIKSERVNLNKALEQKSIKAYKEGERKKQLENIELTKKMAELEREADLNKELKIILRESLSTLAEKIDLMKALAQMEMQLHETKRKSYQKKLQSANSELEKKLDDVQKESVNSELEKKVDDVKKERSDEFEVSGDDWLKV